MQNQASNSKKHRDPELILCAWLFLLAVLEILVVTVLLIQSFSVQDKPTVPMPSGDTVTTAPPTEVGEPSVPVFAGGVIPQFSVSGAGMQTPDGLTSKYAVLVNADTGEIVAGKNLDNRFSPASLTKVMTLIVACEHLTEADLDRKLVFSQDIFDYVTKGGYEGTSRSLPTESGGVSCIGDCYTICDLLYGIGVASAADCTYMIAKEIAGSEQAFVDMMNQKATALGLSNTHFNNAIGYESDENYTTAREMAVIMAYAMQSDLIADILKLRSEDYPIKGYYMDGAEEKSYRVTLKESLQSRMNAYPAFSMTTANLEATKTGYTTQSYIVCTATGKQTGNRYVLVLGEAEEPGSTISAKFKATMQDIELLFNTYAK